MVQITFILPDGRERMVKAEEGLSLMVAAKDHDIDGIDAVCGGSCSCGTCHVVLAQDAFDMTDIYLGEEQILEKLKVREAGSRLACQVTVLSEHEGLMVRVKPTRKKKPD